MTCPKPIFQGTSWRLSGHEKNFGDIPWPKKLLAVAPYEQPTRHVRTLMERRNASQFHQRIRLQTFGATLSDPTFEVVEHLENPDKAIGDFVRLLVPGGRAVVTTPNANNFLSTLARRLGFRRTHSNVPDAHACGEDANRVGHGHISEKNYREWLQLFRRAGFSILHCHRGSLVYGWPWLDERPILGGILIAADGLLDRLLPSPQLAFGSVFVLEKRK